MTLKLILTDDDVVLDSIELTEEELFKARTSPTLAWSIMDQLQPGAAALPEGATLNSYETEDGREIHYFSHDGHQYEIRHRTGWSDVRMYRRPVGTESEWAFVQALYIDGPSPLKAADQLRKHVTGL